MNNPTIIWPLIISFWVYHQAASQRLIGHKAGAGPQAIRAFGERRLSGCLAHVDLVNIWGIWMGNKKKYIILCGKYTGWYMYVYIYIYIYICKTLFMMYTYIHACMHPYIRLHSVTYRYIPLHSITYDYIPLHTTTYRYIPIHTVALHWIALHYMTVHYIYIYGGCLKSRLDSHVINGLALRPCAVLRGWGCKHISYLTMENIQNKQQSSTSDTKVGSSNSASFVDNGCNCHANFPQCFPVTSSSWSAAFFLNHHC
jgi:hypothetical protein